MVVPPTRLTALCRRSEAGSRLDGRVQLPTLDGWAPGPCVQGTADAPPIMNGLIECEERAFEARVSRDRKCPVRIGQL